MTLSLPDDLLREMRMHKEVNWSEVTRRSIRRELDRLHVLDTLLADSRLTEADAIELGREIRKAAANR